MLILGFLRLRYSKFMSIIFRPSSLPVPRDFSPQFFFMKHINLAPLIETLVKFREIFEDTFIKNLMEVSL
jgi:hypothetical protein